MRGYQKKVVFLKNPNSDVFEEAYFIVKENRKDGLCYDIVAEAQRIIKENTEVGKKSSGRKGFRDIILFSAGFLSGALIFLVCILMIF